MNSSGVLRLLKQLFILGVILVVGYFVLVAKRGASSGTAKQDRKKERNGSGMNVSGNEAGQPEDSGIEKKTGASTKDLLWQKMQKDPRAEGELRSITVVHLHLPEDPASQTLARHIGEIRSLYPEQVTVITLDVAAKPETVAEWRMTSAPAVVIQTEDERLFSFEGLWQKPKLEKKVVQLIHGLRGTDKDWRPEVKGMERR